MLKLVTGNPVKKKTDTLVVPVCEKKSVVDHSDVEDLFQQIKGYREFSGKKGEMLTLYAMPGVNARRVLFIGLGKAADVTGEHLRSSVGKATKQCMSDKDKTVSVVVPSSRLIKLDEEEVLSAIAEGSYLANHCFDHYKKEPSKTPLGRIDLMVGPATAKRLKALPDRVQTICDGTLMARNWVSMPSNDKTPEKFVDMVSRQLSGSDVRVSVYDDAQLEHLGFGAMLAVAKGSDNKPALMVCDYDPGNTKKTVVIVGKGVTFDSGGINLKTAEGLALMKMDMSGAAAVAGTMCSLTDLKPDIRVIGVMPLVENMISGDALRPGDIIKSYSGKTVEIGNTDAEGRLILADAMAWAVETYSPDLMIDFATLTGACIVALGEKIAGVFSNNNRLSKALTAASDRTGERCWLMPMPDDYNELLKSDFADISNMASSRSGGAITAALFLSGFVNDTTWAHIDIAGPAYAAKGGDYCPPGGTGFGVRLLCDLLTDTMLQKC